MWRQIMDSYHIKRNQLHHPKYKLQIRIDTAALPEKNVFHLWTFPSVFCDLII